MTKAFTLTAIIQVLREKTFFSKSQNLYVSKNLKISVAFYGWRTFELETGQQRQNGQYQEAKSKKKRSISDFSGWCTFHFYIWARKLVKARESKKRDGQQLKGNLTILWPKIHSKKLWFSKLTSEEIILDLRTRFNIWWKLNVKLNLQLNIWYKSLGEQKKAHS